MTLGALHHVIQLAMGWQDCHLHEFDLAGTRYGTDDGGGWGPPPKDERRAKLSRVAPAGSRFSYEYDFGDSWEHEVAVEKVLDTGPGKTPPICLAGQRACPPEDCGGTWGYEEMLAALADPNHQEHESYREWVGRAFDPEAFDRDEINDRLLGLSSHDHLRQPSALT
jgi:hypothetical protein